MWESVDLQLAQILRQARSRVWIIALVPGLALGALVAMVLISPAAYHTKATVGITSPSGPDTAATVTQSVDSFRAALTSEAVRDAAANDVGLRDLPERNVSSSRVGAANLVDVEVVTTRRDQAQPLLEALVRQANELIFNPLVASAQTQAELAQQQYDETKEAIAGITANGAFIPEEQYKAKAAEVTQLRVLIANARATGSGALNGLRRSLGIANAELRDLAATLRELEDLAFELSRARERLADARTAVDVLEGKMLAASSIENIKTANSTAESQQVKLARAVVAGLIVGIAVALGLVLLIEALRKDGGSGGGLRRSKDTTQPQPSDQPPVGATP